jgi:hypothetical protein
MAKIALQLAFFLSMATQGQSATDCVLNGMAWDNDKECTGSGVAIALPAGTDAKFHEPP